MSQTTDNAPVSAVPTNSTEAPVEKVTFIQKAKMFVKNHKKSTIAVGALVGLVGVAAVTGRKVSDSPETLELYVVTDADMAELEAQETAVLSQES